MHITTCSHTVNTVNTEIFVRVLFLRNFAYAKICENTILPKYLLSSTEGYSRKKHLGGGGGGEGTFFYPTTHGIQFPPTPTTHGIQFPLTPTTHVIRKFRTPTTHRIQFS